MCECVHTDAHTVFQVVTSAIDKNKAGATPNGGTEGGHDVTIFN